MLVARQLGRYHLMDRIALGGMAEIYRAKTFDSLGNEHMVAIKRVLSHLSEDDDFLQMLVDEAKIVSLLDHVNIARVYEFVRVEEEYFIAMEYVDGRDLRSVLDRSRAEGFWLPPEDCAYVLMRVLEGLHSAHEKTDGAGQPFSIVHRDISPSNVIVSYQGHVKLCDFGIAKAKLSRVQTRAGVIKGKVKYMSPEQASGRKLDRRSDIFSCGSVLYELLTRQSPFQAESEMALIFRVRDAKFTKPTRYNPDVPAELEQILRRAMTRSLSSRYQTALEFADALRDYLQEHRPDYSPARLGGLLRKLFAEEIDADLRRLEEYVIGEANPGETGLNLIAEVLGQGAPYTKFSPLPPEPGARKRVDEEEEAMRTRLMPRVPAPEERLPPGVALHELRTEIIDHEEREKRIYKRKHRPRPGARHARDKRRLSQMGTDKFERPAEPDPSSPEFHGAPTRIIRSDDVEGKKKE